MTGKLKFFQLPVHRCDTGSSCFERTLTRPFRIQTQCLGHILIHSPDLAIRHQDSHLIVLMQRSVHLCRDLPRQASHFPRSFRPGDFRRIHDLFYISLISIDLSGIIHGILLVVLDRIQIFGTLFFIGQSLVQLCHQLFMTSFQLSILLLYDLHPTAFQLGTLFIGQFRISHIGLLFLFRNILLRLFLRQFQLRIFFLQLELFIRLLVQIFLILSRIIVRTDRCITRQSLTLPVGKFLSRRRICLLRSNNFS